MIAQTTLKAPIEFSGVALHSGRHVKLVLRPAAPGSGVVFVRTDLPGAPRIPAHFQNIVSTRLATTLGVDSATVSTVEHLLAALYGMGVDNLVVEIDGPEVPIVDGSSEPFCRLIAAVGVQTQLQARPVLALRRRVEVKLNEKWAVAEPSARLEIQGSVDWDHPAIGYQEFHYVEGRDSFRELSAARTFGFLKDVEALKRMGLALGGSLENAVVLDEANVLNPDGLRYRDEFARHKVLDALGDFKLAGISLQAYVRLHRAGHDLHSQLLAEIFRDPDHYEIIDSSVREESAIASLRAALAQSFVASV